MNKLVLIVLIFYFYITPDMTAQTIWLDKLDLSTMESGWGAPQANKSIGGNQLMVGGEKFKRGVGTHAVSTYLLNIEEKGKKFSAFVGLDDESNKEGSKEFYVLGDKKILWKSGIMKKDSPPQKIDVGLQGIKQLGLLVTDGGDGNGWDHADWCDAKIELIKNIPLNNIVAKGNQSRYILTPKAKATPRINGAKVYGVRPGHPFLFKIAATGERPMTFDADNLPYGLTLNHKTGIITGMVKKIGTYNVMLIATNQIGTVKRDFTISVGDKICLTPPMGWNSWNCWATSVNAAKVRTAADEMVKTGLINHGWSYINIDDSWSIKPDGKDSMNSEIPRDKNGMIISNKKFPDMKALSDYVHKEGMKMGIYSSPGPLTCAGYTASYQHELKDVERFAEWGIDYLKYDWCSYGKIAKNNSLSELQKPYVIMRNALNKIDRDIVYSICQYGMGDVWKWGDKVGGNLWRTTGDIIDNWSSMAGIGFKQAGHEKFASPGHWNDPDMLVVGMVGWGHNLHPTRLTPNEQYTHISLWCLLSAPLLLGCDLSRLNNFTLNLLTNDEVLAVDQDPLGQQAYRIFKKDGKQIWIKDLVHGLKAVGLFYVGGERKKPADYFQWGNIHKEIKIILNARDIGITEKFKVRDLWRQKDLGIFQNKFEAEVPFHGVVLIKVTPQK